MTAKEKEELLKEVLDILIWLDEEGDHNGRCVICKSAPCRNWCRIHKALKKGGRK